jgi:two-component system chemotaxis sensor kinase CheA
MQDPAQVVVFANGDRRVGIVVDQIVDIVDETVTVRQQAARRGLLGSAVIGKKITDLLDLHSILDAVDSDWMAGRGQQTTDVATVMVAESSSFARGLVRTCLEMAGYRVIEADGAPDALRLLEHKKVDVVVASLDLPADGATGLLQAMRGKPEFSQIPALALASTREEAQAPKGQALKFEDCQVKFDREAMLRSISKLAAAIAPSGDVPAPAERKD